MDSAHLHICMDFIENFIALDYYFTFKKFRGEFHTMLFGDQPISETSILINYFYVHLTIQHF